MDIHTDRVTKYQPHSAIDSQCAKHSQEYRVLATLRYLYPRKYDDMIDGETPDLQDDKHNVGIEVTVAKSETDAQADGEFSKLHEIGFAEKKKGCIEKIEKCGYSMVPFQNGKYSIMKTGPSYAEKTIFQKAISKKLGKHLREYRAKFDTVGLAIILPEPPTTEFEKHCVEWIREAFQGEQDIYDFVYLLSHRFCLYYNSQDENSEKIKISPEDNRALCAIARMTAEGEITLDDSEWL